jgi:hypothetical protein
VITENVKIDGKGTRVTKSYAVKQTIEVRKTPRRIRRRKAKNGCIKFGIPVC